MKKANFSSSSLWKRINKELITERAVRDLNNFKSNEINYRLALWNPETNGVRYLKTLIYHLCSSLTADDWRKIQRIKRRDFGSPIAVTFNGQLVSLDDLQALFEMKFIASKLNPNNKKIIEIGAGYGRTCHAIMSNFAIKSYCIVDLENCLELSKNYLKKVLTKNQFVKITFISNEEMQTVEDSHFNLAINIDSMAEMEEEVVFNYLDYIDKHCSYFYVKNPTGKYLDKSLDNHARGKRIVSVALRMGILRRIIDIDDNRAVRRSAPRFINAYRPAKGWKCVNEGWAKPWSYYWQALYKRNIRAG